MAVLQNQKPDGSKGERREDRAFWSWFDYFTTKYKLIIWVIVWFVLAAGFKFKTPAQIVDNLQTQIDTLKIYRQEQGNKLDILLRLSCFNDKYTDQQKSLAGLNCNFR